MSRLILVFLLFNISCAPRLWGISPTLDGSLEGSKQMLVVELIENSIFKAKVTAWQRQDKVWREVFATMDAVVGRNGIAEFSQKREGDGKTPSGTFYLKQTFGYAASIDSKIKYRQASDEDLWVDDPNAKSYNQWINSKDLADAKSFERMKRKDNLYEAGLVIEYNTSPPVAGLGSAIFLHIWRGFNQSTAGCVALSKRNVLKLLKWLDPANIPVIVIKK